MEHREEVLSVILEHAIKHRQQSLRQVVLKQTTGSRLPDIFLVISVLDGIYSARNVGQFELAARLIETVYDMDSRVCSFKLYSKLLLGLKMKVLLECLRQHVPDIEAKLNKSLPDKRSETNEMTSKEYIDYHDSVISFRDFFIPLVEDKVSRENYFVEEYTAEYGEDCVNCLMKLLNNFIIQLISHLPQTKMEMLFVRKYEIDKHHGNKELQKLLDFLRGIMILTEEDLIRFLDILDKEKAGINTSTNLCNDGNKEHTFNGNGCNARNGQSHMIKGSERNLQSLNHIELDTRADQLTVIKGSESNTPVEQHTEDKPRSVMKTKQLIRNTNYKRNQTSENETSLESKVTTENSMKEKKEMCKNQGYPYTCNVKFANSASIVLNKFVSRSNDRDGIEIENNSSCEPGSDKITHFGRYVKNAIENNELNVIERVDKNKWDTGSNSGNNFIIDTSENCEINSVTTNKGNDTTNKKMINENKAARTSKIKKKNVHQAEELDFLKADIKTKNRELKETASISKKVAGDTCIMMDLERVETIQNNSTGATGDTRSKCSKSPRPHSTRNDQTTNTHLITECFVEKQQENPNTDKKDKTEKPEVDKMVLTNVNRKVKMEKPEVDKKDKIEKTKLDKRNKTAKLEVDKKNKTEKPEVDRKDRTQKPEVVKKDKTDKPEVDKKDKTKKPKGDKKDKTEKTEMDKKDNDENLSARSPLKCGNENQEDMQVSPVILKIETKAKHKISESKETEAKGIRLEGREIFPGVKTKFTAKRKIRYTERTKNEQIKRTKLSYGSKTHESNSPRRENVYEYGTRNVALKPTPSHPDDSESQTPTSGYMLSQVNPDDSDHFIRGRPDLDTEEFLIIPPSTEDSDSDIELDDLGDEVSFKDAALPEASLPSLEKFRITTPVKLCIVKLFGKKGGIFS